MNEKEDLKLSIIILKMVPDMKTASLFMIITGFFSCLTLAGLIAGIPLIIAGVKLKNAASEFEVFNNGENIHRLHGGVTALKQYLGMMKWYFILTVIAVLIFSVLSVFVLQALIYFIASLAAH